MNTVKITGTLKEIYPARKYHQKIRLKTEDNWYYYFCIQNKNLLTDLHVEDILQVESESHRQGHYYVHSIKLIKKYNPLTDRKQDYGNRENDELDF